jgi:hypothetical protein
MGLHATIINLFINTIKLSVIVENMVVILKSDLFDYRFLFADRTICRQINQHF